MWNGEVAATSSTEEAERSLASTTSAHGATKCFLAIAKLTCFIPG